MNTVLWILQIVLAAMFLMVGAMKIMKSKAELAERMDWVEDFSETSIKTIGGLEVLGAIGLVIPPALGIAEILTPLAAVGLLLTMLGAVAVHVRRSETSAVMMPAVLAIVAAVVAWGRFGPESF